MKTMKKIVAILAVALMLCSILPLSAMAADTTVVFELGANGTATHADGSSKTTYTETVGDYTLNITGGTSMYGGARDAKGNGCLKLGTSSKTGGFSFTVPADVTSVIIAVGKYKANTTKLNINGTAYTVSGASNNGEYDNITIDTSSNKTVTLTTVSGGVRAMVNSITYVIADTGSADCDHNSLVCGEACPECGEYTKEHKYANNCIAECENGCGTANPNYADHVYAGTYDADCDVCFAKREVNLPAADSVLTIAEAIELGVGMGKDNYTEGKYYITGDVTEVYNTTYGNLYITDGENTLTVYGTYSADGVLRYDAMDVKPEAGMTITVYGIIGNYNGTAQMKNGWVTEMIGGCAHEYEYECSTTCEVCGEGVRDVACVNENVACQDGLCIYCGNDVAGLGHAYDSDYDADCNYCGEIREVPEAPSSATITFDDKGKMTSSSTTEQVWAENGIVVNYAKGSYTSNLAEYAAPVRFYKGTVVTIHFSGITSIEIVANSTSYATVLGNSIAGSVVDGKVVTYILPAVADSYAFTLTAQARVDSITVYGSASGDEECEHSWNAATCTTPATCALCGATDGAALGHNYVEDIIDATCTATGTATYECSVCFDSYDEEIPMKPHTYVDGTCSACGAELPLEATITFDADKTQRVEFTTTVQKWENNGLVLINNKAGSTTNIGDYSNPGRFYKTSEIIISFPGMTSLVIDATGIGTDYLWDATLTAAGLSFTVEEKIYTITFAEPTDSITLNAANQVRANSITASAVKTEEECAHEYFNPCEQYCMICGELTNPDAAHNIVHVEAKAPTCAENGNIEYWYCDVCGQAWLNAECTMNTNLRAVVLPATGEHVYFDACSAICEACGYEREVSHNVIHVEAVAPTCAANGNIEYWYCDVCGMAWLNAECTMNTNLRAVVLPASGEHAYDDEYDADCNVCGDIREVPDEPVEIVYGDADGDGEITLLDANLLNQYLSDWDVTLDEVAADADGDGEITLLDANLLNQYLSDWDVTLGPDEPVEQGPVFNDGELTIW